jgi:biopolymer transport protein TolR
MAFHVIPSSSGGSRRRRPMADINVTPLVDVMLVLLIIFMVTAPLLVAGVQVDLPDSRAKALSSDNTPVQISIDGQGQVFIDRQPIEVAALGPKLAAIAQARTDQPRVYVRADSGLDYGLVMQVVGEINAAGLKKVALVTEQKGR